jgi:hypothetical protein
MISQQKPSGLPTSNSQLLNFQQLADSLSHVLPRLSLFSEAYTLFCEEQAVAGMSSLRVSPLACPVPDAGHSPLRDNSFRVVLFPFKFQLWAVNSPASPLFSALPYIFVLSSLFVAFTHCDRGGGVQAPKTFSIRNGRC